MEGDQPVQKRCHTQQPLQPQTLAQKHCPGQGRIQDFHLRGGAKDYVHAGTSRERSPISLSAGKAGVLDPLKGPGSSRFFFYSLVLSEPILLSILIENLFFFFRMRRLGSVAKPLQPAHCVGVWVFEVQIVGWGEGRALVDDVMGGLFLGSAWAGCWWAQTPAVHIGVNTKSHMGTWSL